LRGLCQYTSPRCLRLCGAIVHSTTNTASDTSTNSCADTSSHSCTNTGTNAGTNTDANANANTGANDSVDIGADEFCTDIICNIFFIIVVADNVINIAIR
jgi:hypothetical protein